VEAERQDRIWSIPVRDDSGLALGSNVEVVRRGWTVDMFCRESGQDVLTDCIRVAVTHSLSVLHT